MTCRSDKLQVALKGLTAKLSGKHVFAIGGDDSTLDGRITNAGLVQMYALLPFLSFLLPLFYTVFLSSLELLMASLMMALLPVLFSCCCLKM